MSWKRVCSSTDVPENMVKKFEVNGIEVIVVNYGDGFKIFPPLCPHMEEPLDESGIVEDSTFTCSKHLWQWDLRTGEMQGLAEKDLLCYEVKCEGEDILANIESELVYDYDEDDDMDDDDFFD